MRFVYLFTLAFSLCFLGISAQKNEVLWAVSSSKPPFVYINDNGIITGAEVETMQKVSEKLGYEIRFKILDEGELVDEAKAGNFDFAFFVQKDPANEGTFLYTEPIFALKYLFYKRKNDNVSFVKLKELDRLTIGYSYKYDYPDELQNLFDSGELKTHVLYGDRVNLLGLLEVSAGIINLYTCMQPLCDSVLKESSDTFPNLKDVNYVRHQIGESVKYYMAFPKSLQASQKLRDQYNAALHDYIGSPDHRELLKKYGVSY